MLTVQELGTNYTILKIGKRGQAFSLVVQNPGPMSEGLGNKHLCFNLSCLLMWLLGTEGGEDSSHWLPATQDTWVGSPVPHFAFSLTSVIAGVQG